MPADELVLFDGDLPFSTEYGQPTSDSVYVGTIAFEGNPDAWHEPVINLDGADPDLSDFDEITFYTRCDQLGKSFDFSLYGWPNASNSVAIDDYIEGGTLDAQWRLVRIPVDTLKTPDYDLSNVDRLRFGKAQSSGHQIYVDYVCALNFDIGLSKSVGSLSFPGTNVGQSVTETVTLTNIGAIDLDLALTILSPEFSVSPAAVNLAAGANIDVDVAFAPYSAGAHSATLEVTADELTEPEQVSLAGSALDVSVDIQMANRLLWDGESAFYSEYGQPTNAVVYQGVTAFEGVPDAWHTPKFNLVGSNWRSDLSNADAICFYTRSDETGKTFDFSVHGWPHASNSVNIDDYIEGGTLDSNWRLVKIPVDSLKTPDYNLDSVETLAFGKAQPSSGHRIYIDFVWALDTTNVSSAQVNGTLDFEAVVIDSTAQMVCSVSNGGAVVASITEVTTVGAAEFSISAGGFTLDPGENIDLWVSFTPSDFGNFDGVLRIIHDAVGSTDVPLAGSGVGPVAPVADAVTSSTVSLSWTPESDATETRVYVGSEPPSVLDDPLPESVLVATLSGSSSSHQVSGLAAAVDAFVRVEQDTPAGTLGSNVHARTVGGPRTPLDTPVREVHAYAPDVLVIVIADDQVDSYALDAGGNVMNWFGDGPEGYVIGDEGSQWQQGPWTVTRRDGTSLTVQAIHRDSRAVGSPYYDIGWQANQRSHLIDVDHHLYLELSEAIGSREVLQITGPFGTDFTLPFSDRYLETPVIQLNQVGYSPRATRRWAYVSGWMGDGGALSLSNFPATAEVLSQPADELQSRPSVVGGLGVTVRSSFDSEAGTEVREIDLASVPSAEGVIYRVRLPGVGVSWQTQVNETAVLKSFYTIGRGLYYNRWGRQWEMPYTQFERPQDHPTVFTNEMDWQQVWFDEFTPQTGERPLRGGHHDAGDFDMRQRHYLSALMLMRAYEVNQSAFTDGQLTLPESGNGIPDLLDEVLWSLRGWEELQDADGGIRPGVESYRHPWGIYFADQDPLPYWTFSPDAIETIRFAGLFAQAARLVAPYDAAKAADLEERAIRGYNWALANGAGVINGGPTLYGAGELFRLTGDATYEQMFDNTWASLDSWGNGAFDKYAALIPWLGSMSNQTQPAMGSYLLGYLKGPAADPGYVAVADGKFENYAQDVLDDVLNLRAHRNGRNQGGVDWGNDTGTGMYLMPIHHRLQMGDSQPGEEQDYFDAISLSADYVLGANPMGMVCVTGLGSRYPREPLHLDALSFLNQGQGLMPGIPVFGPVNALPGYSGYHYGANVLHPQFDSRPLLRRYVDLRAFVTTNEFGLHMFARHIQHFSVLLAPGLEPPTAWLPGNLDHLNSLPTGIAVIASKTAVRGYRTTANIQAAVPSTIELGQNAPNPFNASTQISYKLPEAGNVSLILFNSLGQKITELVNAHQIAGTHRITWDGTDESGRVVGNGVYFYRLVTDAGVQSERMVLLK